MWQFISCNSASNKFYNRKDIKIHNLISQNKKKYLIFTPTFESSLNWPEGALCEYNYDSTKVKLFIKRYSAILEDRKPDSNSNIKLLRDCTELKLNYQNAKDSIMKSAYYVIQLPNAVSEVNLSD